MSEQQQVTKQRFTFAVEPFGYEVTWVAEDEKAARRMAWNALADDVKNGVECLDLVEVEAV